LISSDKPLEGLPALGQGPAAATAEPDAPAEGRLATSGGVLVAALLAANILSFLFNAILGRRLSLADFGTITFLSMVLYLFGIFSTALSVAMSHRVTYLSTRYSGRYAAAFFGATHRNVIVVGLALTALWLAVAMPVRDAFQLGNLAVVYALAPTFLLSPLTASYKGLLQGRFWFAVVGIAVTGEALGKLVLGVGLSFIGQDELVALAIPLSVLIGFLLVWPAGRTAVRTADKEAGAVADFASNFPRRFFAASLVSGLSAAVFLSADVFLAKYFLTPDEAGVYSLLSMIGKMVFFLGALLHPFIAPLVGREMANDRDPLKRFHALLGASLLLTVGAVVGLGSLGWLTIPILLGDKAAVMLPYVVEYTAAIACFTVASTLIAYHLARAQYWSSLLSFLSSGVLAALLIWRHDDVQAFVHAEFAASALYLGLALVLHFAARRAPVKLRDDAVEPAAPPATAVQKRILIFNWRDTEHSNAGGAEVYIHELARRWVQDGHAVTMFAGNDGKQARTATIDGVNVVRRGSFYLAYPWAFLYYMFQFRGRFDVIVDCHNGIPFFTPLYAKEPVVCLLHHVHQEVFHQFLPKPLAWLAATLENRLMPFAYRRCPFVTVSESSRNEMQAWGIVGTGIEIINPGIDLSRLTPGARRSVPTILYLGRLKAYKSIPVLLKAFKQVLSQVPDARLVIAGGGEELANLQQLSEELGITAQVEFTGKISEDDKTRHLQEAWVFVNPSMMEGWGITTIEANACGVPVVASNVPGLRDSVREGYSGFLVPYGDEQALAAGLARLITDQPTWNQMSRNALEWAQNFDWNTIARRFWNVVERRARDL
jgi:glycosyltransferase involved in cell wall biosynthesis/O-antigen/teichoic acid export membrane protein